MRRHIDITDIEIPSDENDYDELVAFADAIAEQEIIQLPERKKGKWVLATNFPYGDDCYVCINCKAKLDSMYPNFCPNCGADMRQREDTDE